MNQKTSGSPPHYSGSLTASAELERQLKKIGWRRQEPPAGVRPGPRVITTVTLETEDGLRVDATGPISHRSVSPEIRDSTLSDRLKAMLSDAVETPQHRAPELPKVAPGLCLPRVGPGGVEPPTSPFIRTATPVNQRQPASTSVSFLPRPSLGVNPHHPALTPLCHHG